MGNQRGDPFGSSLGPHSGGYEDASRPGQEMSMPRAQTHSISRPDIAPMSHADLSPLARTIESEIIPRLMLLHRERPARERPAQSTPARLLEIPDIHSPALAEHFLRILLDERVEVAIDFVDRLLIADILFESVLEDLFTPVARKLGALWEDDSLSFVEVTIAMTRLQQVLRSFGPVMAPDLDPAITPRRIFITSVPGEVHTFGASIAEAFFIRDGWDVVTEVGLSRNDLLERVRSEWFDVVGLTVSVDGAMSQVAMLVRRIREASLNPEVRIVLGGAPFLVEPAKALALGGDIEACAGPDVVAAVNRMMTPKKLD